MARLEVRLLGGFEVVRAGCPVTAFESGTARALLARVVADLGHPVSRSRLADQLWPDRARGAALGNLRHALSVVRRAVGDKEGGRPLFRVTPEIITADPAAGWWVDVVEVERLARTPLSSPGAVAAWAEAVMLRRGTFLDGLEVRAGAGWDDWVGARSRAIDTLVIDCLRRLSELREHTGEQAAARSLAEQWLALDPWDERAHRLLMRLLARQGEPGAALVHFEAHAARLATDVGARPGPETLHLAEEIRAARFPRRVVGGRASVSMGTPGQPFVDRVAELAWLGHHLDDAAAGAGRVVVLCGEAGSGKSLLMQAFATAGVDRMPHLLVARGRANAYTGAGDPLLPFRQILGQLCADPGSAQAGPVAALGEARSAGWTADVVDVLVDEGPDLLGSLVDAESLCRALEAEDAGTDDLVARLRAAAEAALSRAGDPSRQLHPLLDQYVRVLRRLAAARPLLVLVDDLQWADAGTLDLLFHLAREVAGAPLLVVAACRSEDIATERASGAPLEPLLHEIAALHPDSRLELGDSRAFVEAWLDAGPNGLGPGFRDRLFDTTRGHALFTVEVVRGMRERGDLRLDDRGRLVEGASLDWDAVPARAEAVIAGRLAHLPAEVRADLDVASVQGEDFDVDVVAGVRGAPVVDVATRLGRLAAAPQPLVVPDGVRHLGGLGPRYRFRHALFQRSLYQHLPGPERTSLHEATGRALEAVHDALPDEVAVDLARHFDEAGNVAEALRHHATAGRRAMRLSATAEAITHLDRALALLHDLERTPAVDRLELDLLTSLGGCLQARFGYTAARTGEVYERARALCARVGPSPEAAGALGAVITFDELRGRYQKALEGTEALAAMAQALGVPIVGAVADVQAGLILVMTGRSREAAERLERVVEVYDPARDGWLTYTLGQDLGITARSWWALSLWMLGHPDLARRRGEEAIAQAREIGHPLSLVFALAIGGCLLAHLRGEPDVAALMAAEVGAIAEREDLAFYKAAALVHGGVPRALLGDLEGGLADLERGLAGWRDIGTEAFAPWVGTWRAEILLHAGRLPEAAVVLDDVEAHIGEEASARHRLLLLRGRLLDQAGDTAAAEAALARAVTLAHDEAARGPELQAATALARVRFSTGRTGAAWDVLAPVLTSFTEGEGTPDLIDARALLDAIERAAGRGS